MRPVVIEAPRHTAAAAMLVDVKLSGAGTTVGEVRALFGNDHVHCAVIVDDGALLAVIDRSDVDGSVADEVAAVRVGRLDGRVIAPEADLEEAWTALRQSGRRRLAVVGPGGRFLGLLCLKRTRRGFCSDRDIRARAQDVRAQDTRAQDVRADALRSG